MSRCIVIISYWEFLAGRLHVEGSITLSDAQIQPGARVQTSVWFLVGNGGMGYWDYYRGLYMDYHKDPFRHSLLSTRQTWDFRRWSWAPRLRSKVEGAGLGN